MPLKHGLPDGWNIHFRLPEKTVREHGRTLKNKKRDQGNTQIRPITSNIVTRISNVTAQAWICIVFA